MFSAVFQGYYRRAVVMSAMGQHEEAFVSFALCAALDSNTQAMKTEITRVCTQTLMRSRVYACVRMCVRMRLFK